ncbi:hypothetical protein M6G65_04460 [Methylobacterium tardum]|uniref:hypothetical protein n=1 Tax=Methylobacterium tardum TaxID=374432 RepID=UPI00202237EB|nr:hypothetical protein [Methylobacterium tardum]URD37805.1 hypothetical protein M6G65_04460 [Methylobacterium tardum]
MVLICVSAGTAMLLADWLLTLQRLRRLQTVLRQRSYGTVTIAFGPDADLATLLDLLATMGFRVKASTLVQGEDGGSLRCIGSRRGDSLAWALDAVARLRAVRRAGRI